MTAATLILCEQPLRRRVLGRSETMTQVTARCGIVSDAVLRFPFRRADVMGMAAPIYWTAEMVRALPDDGNKYECVYGELLVSPAPRPWHEVIVGRLFMLLSEYAEREDVGYVFASRSDISWSDDTLVQPDVFVVPLSEARTLMWSAMKSLQLAVEVLSPSSVRADRFSKRRLYQDVRIPLYWILDADAHEIEVWTPDVHFPHVERERVMWAPTAASRPLIIELGELFKPL